MLRFINPNTVLLFHSSLNRALQRTKVLTKNRQLQAAVTTHNFSNNFIDAINMPPKRGRPPKVIIYTVNLSSISEKLIIAPFFALLI